MFSLTGLNIVPYLFGYVFWILNYKNGLRAVINVFSHLLALGF